MIKKILSAFLACFLIISAFFNFGCAGIDSDNLSYHEPTSVEEVSDKFNIHSINIPKYSGKQIVKINDNKPFFNYDELSTEFFIDLSPLDELNRCQGNIMCADEPHIQTGERSSISDIHPTGWHSGGFYQRSHLLMWKLSGCNVEENLISGTDTFNQESMLEYEERVTAYLWKHENNHVMYRVTPLFEGKNLVATGVLMEAYSVEDDGAFSFCVFVYNTEPGYEIDYATGDYWEKLNKIFFRILPKNVHYSPLKLEILFC